LNGGLIHDLRSLSFVTNQVAQLDKLAKFLTRDAQVIEEFGPGCAAFMKLVLS